MKQLVIGLLVGVNIGLVLFALLRAAARGENPPNDPYLSTAKRFGIDEYRKERENPVKIVVSRKHRRRETGLRYIVTYTLIGDSRFVEEHAEPWANQLFELDEDLDEVCVTTYEGGYRMAFTIGAVENWNFGSALMRVQTFVMEAIAENPILYRRSMTTDTVISDVRIEPILGVEEYEREEAG